MIGLPASIRIYLAAQPVDMRRGHDGLSAIVQGQWKQELFAGHLFVFVGKRRDRVKILFWEHGGLVLYYKRLERGRFVFPPLPEEAQSVRLEPSQLVLLLEGVDLRGVRRVPVWEPGRLEIRQKIDTGSKM